MNVGCPQCSSIFRVDPAKVPAGGVRARCSICGGVIPVPEPTQADLDNVTGSYERYQTPVPPLAPPPAPAQTPVREPAPTPPPFTESGEMTPPSGAWPADTGELPAPAAFTAPPFTPPETEMFSTPTFTPPQPETMTEAPQTPPTTTDTPPNEELTVTGSHVNPYLTRDPHARARRLSRALVSDIVAYYRDKHEEALRSGDLKEQFREEIKKSYEDYVSQVGAELAQSTTYFQDALNEVLARGKRIF